MLRRDIWWIAAVVPVFVGTARADLLHLKHGGEIRGTLVTEDGQADGEDQPLLTIRTQSGTTISVRRDDVEFLQHRPPLVEEYVTRSHRAPDSVEARWELAEWCRQNQLGNERNEQLELLLDVDPDHADARRLLGYVRHLGRWVLKDDLMTERGYVKHKGRWITRQEFELLEQTSAQKEAELVWYPKVRLWVAWMTGNHVQRQTLGQQELEAIADPDAVAALTTNMAEHENSRIRLLYARILGGISGERPVKPLVERYLFDQDGTVRQMALSAVQPVRHGMALPYLVKALKHDLNVVVQRAAQALGRIGDERAIPHLIDALVTSHRYKVQVPLSGGMTFGTSRSGQVGLMDSRAPSTVLPPEVEMLARAGQLPFGAIVMPDPVSPRPMKTVTVRTQHKNSEALSALQSLTGKNFGYNQRDWSLWWAVQKS